MWKCVINGCSFDIDSINNIKIISSINEMVEILKNILGFQFSSKNIKISTNSWN